MWAGVDGTWFVRWDSTSSTVMFGTPSSASMSLVVFIGNLLVGPADCTVCIRRQAVALGVGRSSARVRSSRGVSSDTCKIGARMLHYMCTAREE